MFLYLVNPSNPGGGADLPPIGFFRCNFFLITFLLHNQPWQLLFWYNTKYSKLWKNWFSTIFEKISMVGQICPPRVYVIPAARVKSLFKYTFFTLSYISQVVEKLSGILYISIGLLTCSLTGKSLEHPRLGLVGMENIWSQLNPNFLPSQAPTNHPYRSSWHIKLFIPKIPKIKYTQNASPSVRI